MIELKNLKKKFADFEIEVNLDIEEGEILGLIGKSGSGKSTILKIIQGIIKKDSGEIKIKKGCESSYIFQEFNLLYNKTVFENISLPLKLKKIFNRDSEKKIREILKFTGLLEKERSYISCLSGGEKQRVAIARALITNPEILLCDEVTASLDNEVKEEILSLFEKINLKYNTTILIVTHELDIIRRLCRRAAIIEKGKITEILPIPKNKMIKKGMSYTDYIKEVLKNED